MEDPIRQRIATKALIVNPEGKLLIVREAVTYADSTQRGKYTFPGGRIDPGEPHLEGLMREISEETGLRVKVGRPLFVEEWFPKINDERNHIVAIYFQCEPLTQDVRLSDEHDHFEWVTPGEMAAYELKGPKPEMIASLLTAN